MKNDDPLVRIEKRFNYNINRVANLISLFDLMSVFRKKSSSQKQDLLRSAVVLLHASLEDLLREVIRNSPPLGNAKFTKELLFEVDGKRASAKDKISIFDLISVRNQSVDDIVKKSIAFHLDRRSFNHVGDIKESLKQIEIDADEFKDLFPIISKAIERRHKIVHRSDRSEHSEQTHGAPTPLKKDVVEEWTTAIGRLGVAIIKKLKDKPPVQPPPPEPGD